MARKDELANQLSGGERPARRPGWRDTISAGRPVEPAAAAPEPEPEPVRERSRARSAQAADQDRQIRKTYILTPQLVERIAALAAKERVAINELVRFLLTEALLQVENRELTIPTKPARRQINMEDY